LDLKKLLLQNKQALAGTAEHSCLKKIQAQRFRHLCETKAIFERHKKFTLFAPQYSMVSPKHLILLAHTVAVLLQHKEM
jgi:hypothetical protein